MGESIHKRNILCAHGDICNLVKSCFGAKLRDEEKEDLLPLSYMVEGMEISPVKLKRNLLQTLLGVNSTVSLGSEEFRRKNTASLTRVLTARSKNSSAVNSTVKQNSEGMEFSPDSEEFRRTVKVGTRSRTKAPSPTSVLTSRSKNSSAVNSTVEQNSEGMEFSPDSEEFRQTVKVGTRSRTKAPSPTSVLTSRSKNSSAVNSTVKQNSEGMEFSPDSEEFRQTVKVETRSRTEAPSPTSVLTSRSKNSSVINSTVKQNSEGMEFSPDSEAFRSRTNTPTTPVLSARSKLQNLSAVNSTFTQYSEGMEFSPDSEEFRQTVKVRTRSRTNAPSPTSVLTARSKVVCAVRDKQKAQIVDNEADYVEDMYKYYESAENEGRAHDYMNSQPEITEDFRAILIDFLVQVHDRFKLTPETLYLTVNIVDRYLAIKTTSLYELQLVGISSTLIASKYEEVWAPKLDDLVSISDRGYSDEQVLVMEKQILGALDWNLTVPTLYVFLARFIHASTTESEVENLAYFLGEIGMMNYSSALYSPSMIAASAVYVARCTMNQTPCWNETLKSQTGFSEAQLMDCAKLLVSFHSTARSNLSGIWRKYSSSERDEVAFLPTKVQI